MDYPTLCNARNYHIHSALTLTVKVCSTPRASFSRLNNFRKLLRSISFVNFLKYTVEYSDSERESEEVRNKQANQKAKTLEKNFCSSFEHVIASKKTFWGSFKHIISMERHWLAVSRGRAWNVLYLFLWFGNELVNKIIIQKNVDDGDGLV